MRREVYRMDREEAIALLERAPVVRIATTAADGAPLLRTVHGVLVDGAVAFHGAPAGEKVEAIGREAVVAAEEIVAQIPSYFVDPERACPATTYYRSVMVHGRVEEVLDPEAKSRVLRALMKKLQPEGGHAPIDPTHPLYRGAVAGIMVLRVSLERLDGKAKLAQNRTPAEVARILEQLWKRGQPGDAEAVELVRAANPLAPTPSFLAAPEGARLRCVLGREHVEGALALLEGGYWNGGIPADAIARAHLGAAAWVGAVGDDGALIATARAIADGAKNAWIHDVAVAPAWRGRGLGRAVMRLLLDHPSVRAVRSVRLATRDAQEFYGRMGFRAVRAGEGFPEMLLSRG